MGSNPTRATQDWSAGGRAEEVTEEGLVQSAGPNVQLASLSLQGQPVRWWRRGHALAGAPMGNSWLRRALDGNVCLRLRGADPAFHPFGGVAQQSRALACQARGRRFESGRPRFRGGRGVDGSIRGCEPRWRRFEPGRPPLVRTLSIGELSRL